MNDGPKDFRVISHGYDGGKLSEWAFSTEEKAIACLMERVKTRHSASMYDMRAGCRVWWYRLSGFSDKLPTVTP